LWHAFPKGLQGVAKRMALGLGNILFIQLWMTVGEFIDLKVTKEKSRIPEYRFFEL
jgi:hypothetical protein